MINNKPACEKISSHAGFVFTFKYYFLIDRKEVFGAEGISLADQFSPDCLI